MDPQSNGGSSSSNGYQQHGLLGYQDMLASLGLNFSGGLSAQTVEATREQHSFPIGSHSGFTNIDGGNEGVFGDSDKGEDENFKEEIERNKLVVDAAEKARQEMTEEALAAFGIVPDDASLVKLMDGQQAQVKEQVQLKKRQVKRVKARRDFFSDLANFPELVMELAKHLKVKDHVSLYAISKDFHQTLNESLSHCMRGCAEHNAPESAKVFIFTFYNSLCVLDPVSRPHPQKSNTVRKVPGLRWLQMIIYREKTVRDILACMARQGHRMPKGMSLSLKKMWLLMEIATTARRSQFIHSKFFTDWDLYHIQMFIVKLDMRFNDPIDGPGDSTLRNLFLGQRSLTPLCKLLKRTAYTSAAEVIKMGIRYTYNIRPEHRGMPMWDIPPQEIGIGHLEAWGAGRIHLRRPDELVVVEAVRRSLDLKDHIMGMLLWGYVDPITGQDIKVTDEEKYMSDDEEKPRDQNWNDYEERDEDEDEDEWEGEGEGEMEMENDEENRDQDMADV
jgi:hypothetical protein